MSGYSNWKLYRFWNAVFNCNWNCFDLNELWKSFSLNGKVGRVDMVWMTRFARFVFSSGELIALKWNKKINLVRVNWDERQRNRLLYGITCGITIYVIYSHSFSFYLIKFYDELSIFIPHLNINPLIFLIGVVGGRNVNCLWIRML